MDPQPPLSPRSRSAATPPLILAAALLLLGCGAGADPHAAERVDSAGVTLVTSAGEDRPLSWSFEPELTLGGDDFYRVGRWNVDTDAAGTIYVLDEEGKRVLRYRPDGTPLPPLGGPGDGPGELAWPNILEVSEDGRISVSDFGRGRVITWGTDGTLRGEDPGADPGALFRRIPGGEVRAVDDWGAEQSVARLVVVTEAGDSTELARITWTGRPITLESCGMRFSGMAPIFTPSLRWDVAGERVAVVSGPEYEIAVSDAAEPRLRVRRRMEPRPATEELAVTELGEGMAVVTQGGRRVCEPLEVAQKRGVADRVPLIERVVVEPGGRLWVERFVAGDQPGPIDVFAADGSYLGTLPAGTPLPIGFLPDGRALTAATDEMDVQRLVIGRFREGSAGG